MKRAGRIAFVPDPLYHYVFREGSLINHGVTEKRCTVLPVLERICEDAAATFPEVEFKPESRVKTAIMEFFP